MQHEVGLSGGLHCAGFRSGSYFQETDADKRLARRRVRWWAAHRPGHHPQPRGSREAARARPRAVEPVGRARRPRARPRPAPLRQARHLALRPLRPRSRQAAHLLRAAAARGVRRRARVPATRRRCSTRHDRPRSCARRRRRWCRCADRWSTAVSPEPTRQPPAAGRAVPRRSWRRGCSTATGSAPSSVRRSPPTTTPPTATSTPTTDCSPHPLFEDVVVQAVPGRRTSADPQARATASPHPLVDVARIVAEHPDAARHPHGPLAWWVVAGPRGHRRPGARRRARGDLGPAARGRPRGGRAAAGEQRRCGSPSAVPGPRRRPSPTRPRCPPPGAEPLVTVVLAVRDDGPRLRAVVDAVQAQTYDGWELVVVDDGSADDTAAVLAGVAAYEPRVVPVTVPRGGRGRARNAALDKARGTYVAFADPDHTWDPDFLRVMLGHLEAEGAPMAHAAMRRPARRRRVVPGRRGRPRRTCSPTTTSTWPRSSCGATCWPRSAASTRRSAAPRRSTWCSGSRRCAPLRLVRRVLLDRADDADDEDPRWTATVLERHLVDWQAAQHRPREARRVSIVLHTTSDLDRTVRWVTRTMSRRRENADVELVVVGSRLPRDVELPLAMLLATLPQRPPARGPAPRSARRSAPTSASPRPPARWWCSPARPPTRRATPSTRWSSALADHDVAIAQPLVVDRPGLVVSAGAVFGPGRTHPEPFLAGHPVSDAQALTSREVPAPLSPVVAVRGSELVRLRGYDVWIGDALPEVELGVRMAAHDGGATVVVPQAPLVLKAGQLPRLDTTSDGVRALQQRWPLAPAGLRRGLGAGGVRGRRPPLGGPLRGPRARDRDPLDAPALTPRTVVRPSRAVVREGRAGPALGPRHRRALGTSRPTLGRHVLRPVAWPRRSSGSASASPSTPATCATATPATSTTSCWCCAGSTAWRPGRAGSTCSG